MSSIPSNKKVTIQTFIYKKAKKEKISVLTAYDYYLASLIDQVGFDAILVGDSASNVIHGHSTTIPMTMDIMIAHASAVSRGSTRALIIGDMPFLSYQASIEDAVRNAGRFLKEGNTHAVKMEGGIEMIPTIKRVIECGIPVMGHIGLTPQSIHRFGGPKVQGRKEKSKAYLLESAQALEEAGCFSIVLELMDKEIAGEISTTLKTCATIGIGAGVDCDGQVLVINDMLGLKDPNFNPKYLRQYADLTSVITDAIKRFLDDVKSGAYPSDNEAF